MSRAVEAVNLGKRYEIGLQGTPYQTLRGHMTERFRGGAPPRRSVWALKDFDLAIEEGEAVGIVGANGAGKSTFLKLLTRITRPTTGLVRHRGRAGALLEVGTGFHPELTGRENVYLNGTLLGMRRRQVEERFDEIVDFSGIEAFIDTPVKRYSSGMHVRLAFAVAAHLDVDVLIVDEVLAVGDEAFQRKCLGKMSGVAQAGRTVVLVSHNLAAVESLSHRVVWLQDGAIRADGPPREVIRDYLEAAVGGGPANRLWEADSAPGNDAVRLRAASASNGRSGDGHLTIDAPVALAFEYDNLEAGARLNLSLHVYNAAGVLVLNAVATDERAWSGKPFPAGRFRERCELPPNLLNNGRYRVELLVVRDRSRVLYRHDGVLEFDVHDVPGTDGVYEGEWQGVVRPPVEWQIERCE